MSIRDSDRLKAAINAAHAEAGNLSNENQSRLAQLMTIWGSGFLEARCREILRSYSERHSGPLVCRFVSQSLERFNNPRADRIFDLVRSFDKERAIQLEEFAKGSIRESVNGMVAQRHRIAHGRSTDTTITRISLQFEDAKKFAKKLEELFLNDSGIV